MDSIKEENGKVASLLIENAKLNIDLKSGSQPPN
jgi:hypothetical protein